MTTVLIGIGCGLSVAHGGTTDPIGDGIGAGIFGALIIAIVPALIVGAITSAIARSAQRDSDAFKKRISGWNLIALRFEAAYYCSRDDLVFDSKLRGHPEAFRATIWNGYKP
ncbi:hypothetical protein ACX9R5_03250 [Rathayibacter sp. CAU 1779]